MTPIRPNPGQILQPPAARAGSDARAAFFQAVLSGQPPAATPVAAAPVRAEIKPAAPMPNSAQTQAQPAPAEGERYRRPGSLIDIRV